jgi:hypothetical protein
VLWLWLWLLLLLLMRPLLAGLGDQVCWHLLMAQGVLVCDALKMAACSMAVACDEHHTVR